MDAMRGALVRGRKIGTHGETSDYLGVVLQSFTTRHRSVIAELLAPDGTTHVVLVTEILD